MPLLPNGIGFSNGFPHHGKYKHLGNNFPTKLNNCPFLAHFYYTGMIVLVTVDCQAAYKSHRDTAIVTALEGRTMLE